MNLPTMRFFILPLAAAGLLTGCSPRALFFHESTKLAFAATYNTSDSQPLATSFGFKRRIVAVVPSQDRDLPEGGRAEDATNKGEALSLVSKFSVRAGTAGGVVIVNNFASGMAAQIMTQNRNDKAVSAMMHSDPVTVSPETGTTAAGLTAMQAVNARLAGIAAKEVDGSKAPPPTKTLPRLPKTKVPADASTTLPEQGATPPKPTGILPSLPPSQQPPPGR